MVAALAAVLVVLAGCSTSQSSTVQISIRTASPDFLRQFEVVSKDGIEIACPKYWHSDPDPALVYCASRSDYVKITVGVLPALPQTYYDGLVAQGTVTEAAVNGYLGYTSEYAYAYEGHQLTTRCITLIQGSTACHVMTLCEASLQDVFAPIIEYVVNSIKFLATEQS
jgi:hypothetical protein